MTSILSTIARALRRPSSTTYVEPVVERDIPLWQDRVHVPAPVPSDMRPTPQGGQLRSSGSHWASSRPPPMPVVPPPPKPAVKTIRESPRQVRREAVLPSAADFNVTVLPPMPPIESFR